MGWHKRDQGQLFYCFNLGGRSWGSSGLADCGVPGSVVGPGRIGTALFSTGRRFDPVPTIRMLIVGYVFAIRSERALCREVQVNLANRWFCGLGIEDKVPDHSVFSRARNERFRNHDIFRQVFERVVAVCIRAGLVGGEGFAVDASLIEADANKGGSIPGSEWTKDIDPTELAVQ